MFKKFSTVKMACDAFTLDKELPWLQALDKVEGMELWGGQNREDREPWKQYLQKADDILRKPRKQIPKDLVEAILKGDMVEVGVSSVPTAQPKVVVFVSSTFTDTKAERNHLMKDVYPFLRSLCRRLGVEFGTVDMRWGVTSKATSDHSTVQMCVDEIHRCIRDSVGPAFLCLLGHKYGYRCLPAQIEQSEFETLQAHIEKDGQDTKLLKRFYTLDHNAVPSEYVLKPKDEKDTNWWDDQITIQKQMREASVACFGETNPVCDKYHISVTETEIHNGVFTNDRAKEQSIFVRRNLNKYSSDFHLNRKITDLVDGKVDEYAKTKLAELQEKKIPEKASYSPSFKVSYDEAKTKEIADDIREVCDNICKTLADNVLSSYEDRLHVEEDRVFQEALQHRTHANDKGKLFVGRDHELGRIMDYIRSDNKCPLVVHGQSGCGKTAIMAVAAMRAKSAIPHGIVALRFLGTTGQSASARLLLYNVCAQISRVYGEDVLKIPSSYKELIKYFRTCLAFATSDKPLIVFLDSLDQLSNEDFGQNLAWLSLAEELPGNVKLIVSSLPSTASSARTLDILQSNIPDKDQFLEVKALSLSEGPEIMTKMLQANKRKVTEPQKQIIINAFKKCPLPLFLRLVVDIALKWHSYDQVDPKDIADDMPGLINRLFNRLEAHYGYMFVHHALAYITCSKNGLSLAELEDVLSCDDDVLDSIFKYWVPPIRRIPPLLWARVRNELGDYLVERGTDGVSAYGWYHRQFWETAEKRYLQKPFDTETQAFERTAHIALADYFEGKWEIGKPYENKKDKQMRIESRKVPKQPLVVSGQRGSRRQLNKRKLTELPYHLIQLKDWERFMRLVLDLPYIETKFEAMDGYNCLSELIEATKLSGVEEIKQMTRFVGANLGFLVREPDGIYQMALQQSQGNHIRNLVEYMGPENWPKILMKNIKEDTHADPCEMSLHGHTATLRCCNYSPTGDLLVSSADDSTMRIWDTTTGAELVTISSLPAPVFPDKSVSSGLMLHAVNPCCFSKTGERIANGTEQGGVMIWDKTGVQLHAVQTPNKAVSYIEFSPDNKHIATTFTNSVLGVWSADNLSLVASVNIGWSDAECCSYSHDGKRLAVMCTSGLVLFSVNGGKYELTSKTTGQCYQNLCCAFLPVDGSYVMTGGDDSCVSIWSGTNGVFQGRLRQHKAWIWSIAFTSDACNMFTCSSDRLMKVWKRGSQALEWSVVATVGGHSHRVSMVSIERGTESKLVTSSLDRTLKVWDLKKLIRGEVPPTGGGHYLVCLTSPCGKYVASSQGWSRFCNLVERESGKWIGKTTDQVGFVRMARIDPAGRRLLVLDHGHCGTYDRGAAKNAKVMAFKIPSLQPEGAVPVASPTSLAVNNYFIVVGTDDGIVSVFNWENLVKICDWKCPNGDKTIAAVAVSQTTKMIAAAHDSTCFLMKLGDNKMTVVKKLTVHDDHVAILEFSVDGKYLVHGSSSGKLYIYDASKPEVPLFKINTEHASFVMDIQFSASGNFMLTSAALSLRVWDVKAGFKLKCTYYAPVNCGAFVNDEVVLAGEATGNMKTLSF